MAQKKSDTVTPVMIAMVKAAVASGDDDGLTRMLDSFPDAIIDLRDDNGQTPLSFAASQGQLSIVALLLARGADINLPDAVGDTALIAASANHYPEIVALLLSKNARLEGKNFSGTTALLWAARNNHLDIVTPLLDAGANINTADRDGNTPLINAARQESLPLFSALLARGASFETANKAGETAETLALQNNTDAGRQMQDEIKTLRRDRHLALLKAEMAVIAKGTTKPLKITRPLTLTAKRNAA